MQLRKQLWRRSLLAFCVAGVALTWSDSGRAQVGAPCLVERGQDPLDVLNTGLRHNVWVILDTAGSMNVRFSNSNDTRAKLEVTKDVLNRFMNELVDGAGRPLVNWAFVPCDQQSNDGNRCPTVPPDVNGDGYSDKPNAWHGLLDEDYVNPGTFSRRWASIIRLRPQSR
jgi:hypothetical protein